MRVAFVVNAFPVVSETFVLSQITGAIDRGHDVDIYACDRIEPPVGFPSSDFERYRLDQRVRYFDVPAALPLRIARGAKTLVDGWRAPLLCARSLNVMRYGRMAASLRLLNSLRSFLGHTPAYDVIHCQFGPLGNIALRLRQIGAWNGALVTAFRGYDATKLLKQSPNVYADLFQQGDLFLPVSAALRDVLIAHGCGAGKIEVHHSGIDCRRLQYRPRTLAVGECVKLLSIARLVEKKGIDIAVRAVAQLVRAGHDVQYDVIGDGEQRATLERLIVQLDLGSRVRLVGWRDHAEALAALERSHILVAPSVTAADGDQEGIPNALKEAMALGIPVAATRHGGNAELVDDGVSGLLVAERDEAALAAAISRLVHEAARWPSMGQAGRRKIETEFDLQRLNASLDGLYARAIEAHANNACPRRPERWVANGT